MYLSRAQITVVLTPPNIFTSSSETYAEIIRLRDENIINSQSSFTFICTNLILLCFLFHKVVDFLKGVGSKSFAERISFTDEKAPKDLINDFKAPTEKWNAEGLRETTNVSYFPIDSP